MPPMYVVQQGTRIRISNRRLTVNLEHEGEKPIRLASMPIHQVSQLVLLGNIGITTPAIGNLIREGKTYQIESMMQAGRGLGMHTMDQHLADLVNAGVITREAALEKAHDEEGINRLIQRVPTSQAPSASMSSGIDFGDSYSGGSYLGGSGGSYPGMGR